MSTDTRDYRTEISLLKMNNQLLGLEIKKLEFQRDIARSYFIAVLFHPYIGIVMIFAPRRAARILLELADKYRKEKTFELGWNIATRGKE